MEVIGNLRICWCQ